MNKAYITLFKELARAMAVSAETVMDYDHEVGDAEGFKTATTMRDDYQALAESLDNLGEDYGLNKSDAAKLLIGAMTMINQFQSRIDSLRVAIEGYQTDVIPKLQKIVDEAKDDDEAVKMAHENFIIENNN